MGKVKKMPPKGRFDLVEKVFIRSLHPKASPTPLPPPRGEGDCVPVLRTGTAKRQLPFESIVVF